MIDLENLDKVYLYPESTDLRKGINALSYLVGELEKDDHLHKLFLFCNRKEKIIKIYEKDETGTWIYIKRLDDSRYGWPKDIKEAMNINKEQLSWLMQGLKVIKNPNKKHIKICIKKYKSNENTRLIGCFLL